MIRVASYKKDVDVKVKRAKDVAFDSFKEEIFILISDENPALYKELIAYLDKKQAEYEEEE